MNYHPINSVTYQDSATCASRISGFPNPAGWIWAGRPARAFRQLKPAERAEFARARDIYVGYSSDYRGSSGA